jgi:hypothetical protein
MPFKMKGFSGFKSSPMKKSMGPTEDKINFEKPTQKRTKKQVRQEDRAERRATRKSEGTMARQALRRGINKVKSKTSNVRNTVKLAASNVGQKFKKKKAPAQAQVSRKIQAPKTTTKINVRTTPTTRIKGVVPDNFGDAFKQARKNIGPGGKFKYRGRLYSTDTKEDIAKRKKAANAKLKHYSKVKSYKMGEDPSLD